MKFSTYLKEVAKDSDCSPGDCGLRLHETLNQLSLPGVLAVISCFGARLGAHQALPSARFQKLGRTVDSISLVSRGLRRLEQLCSTPLKDWPFELMDLILLQRMIENSFHAGDTFVARDILLASNLMPAALTAQLRAQMSLFDDEGS